MLVLLLLFPSLFLLGLLWLRFRPQPIHDPSTAAAASSRSSTSTPNGGTSRRNEYKVFLSFRGEDTRDNFVSHLHKELQQKGIHTFKDDPNLRKGGSLTSLLDVISSSSVAVVILSEHYASSTWCLKELVKIMECRKRNGQLVVPIFYKVDPSDVRNHKGSFGKDLEEHEKKKKREMDSQDEMEKWRNALTEVAAISGWDSRNMRDEANLIEDVVRDISDKLACDTSSDACDHLVAIGSQIAEIDKLLEVEKEVHMLGIWGMGGIGKTTLAKVFYDRMSSQYQACCFLGNVKDKFQKFGATSLRKELLSKILLERNLDTWCLDKDSSMIKDRLCYKTVLIVLDDVDDIEQLEVLAKHPRWFGLGSTIIITTRDKRLLDQHKIDTIYEVKCLKNNEALQLFSRHAFEQNQIKEDYWGLATDFVYYAHGLPLALQVLGRLLHNRPIDFWKDELQNLRRTPKPSISDVLKLSFIGLEDNEKDVFLDIACFYNRTHKDEVRRILNTCGLFPDRAFPILIEKSLISIQENLVFMHELLYDMGRDIVRRESAKPGERSRLWDSKDIRYVLTKKKGTEMIKGISLDLCEIQDKMNLDVDAFLGMDHLRFLKVYMDDPDYVREDKLLIQDKMHCGFRFCTDDIAYLHWEGYPLKSLSLESCANLVELDLSGSALETLWEGALEFVNLKFLNLEGSEYLVRIPDLSKAKNIVEINLRLCYSLVEVHSSIQYLDKLEHFELEGCVNLEALPSRLDSNVLKYFDLSSCYKVVRCPELFSPCLESLQLEGASIKELPSSIENLSRLKWLDADNCEDLSQLPNCFGNLKSLEQLSLTTTAITELPLSIEFLSSLKSLSVAGCKYLSQLPNCLSDLKSLEHLYLGSTSIKELPSSIEFLSNLKSLCMNDCKDLSQLPNCLGNFQSLEILDLKGTAITELPSSTENLSKLKWLYMSGCKDLSQLPNCLGNLQSLEILDLKGTAITELPSSMENLSKLKWLFMSGCKDLSQLPNCLGNLQSLELLNLEETAITELPSSMENLSKLKWLYMSGCQDLSQLPNCLGNLQSLEELNLERTAIKELPSSMENLRSLKVFTMSGCKYLSHLPNCLGNLKILRLDLAGTSIMELPESFENLLRLDSLNLSYCEKLESLPTNLHRLAFLSTIIMDHCKSLRSIPKLPQRLRKLRATYCESLENFSDNSNNNYEWITYCCFDLRECFKLNKEAHNNILSFALSTFLRYDNQGAKFLLPGSEIPPLIHNQAVGSSINVQTPSNFETISAVLCCLVFECEDLSLTCFSGYKLRYRCQFKVDNRNQSHIEGQSIFSDVNFVGSSDQMMLYSFEKPAALDCVADNELSFEFFLEGLLDATLGSKIKVSKCGISFLVKQEHDCRLHLL